MKSKAITVTLKSFSSFGVLIRSATKKHKNNIIFNKLEELYSFIFYDVKKWWNILIYFYRNAIIRCKDLI